MNLAFEFLNIHWLTGGSEYMRRIFWECMSQIEKNNRADIHLFAIIDSTYNIAFPDLTPDSLRKKIDITFVDIKQTPISKAIKQHQIDRLFVSCSMALGQIYPDCANISCEVIMVSHDIFSDELYGNQLGYYFKFIRSKYFFENRDEPGWKIYFRLGDSTPKLVRWLIHTRRDRVFERQLGFMKPILSLLNNNPNVHNIAISDYTKATMIYHYGLNPDSIKVLWSPERVYNQVSGVIENEELRNIVESKVPFYLMVSANRENKNPHKAVRAFTHYHPFRPDMHLVAIGYESSPAPYIHNIDYLSDNDLLLAYRHCYALLYPSFFEGFGIPPLEAMHQGKPVLCSNATSMPEIYGDAPIWFSPLYESGIFQALLTLTDDNYQHYVDKSKAQYGRILQRINADLSSLLSLILD